MSKMLISSPADPGGGYVDKAKTNAHIFIHPTAVHKSAFILTFQHFHSPYYYFGYLFI